MHACSIVCGERSDGLRHELCRLSSCTRSAISTSSIRHTSILACLFSPHTRRGKSFLVLKILPFGSYPSARSRSTTKSLTADSSASTRIVARSKFLKEPVGVVIGGIAVIHSSKNTWVYNRLGEIRRLKEGIAASWKTTVMLYAGSSLARPGAPNELGHLTLFLLGRNVEGQ